MHVFEFKNADAAMEFFDRCGKQKATTEEERTKILAEMAEEGLMQRVYITGRTPEEYVEDVSKHQSVLYIKGKEHGNS